MSNAAEELPTPVILRGSNLREWLDLQPYQVWQDVKKSLYSYLSAQRLRNYGDYAHTDWKRLQGQRQRVRRAMRQNGVSLEKACDTARLEYDIARNEWYYLVGQSNNEEFTNLIANLCGYEKKGWLK